MDHGHVHLTAGSAWDVFNASLKAAIRDIASHPRGKLFRRLLSMTPGQAAYTSIKMMLYYVILRYISDYQGHRAIKLYNAYAFGYPLAVDAKDMLWPEDLSN